MKNRWQLQIIWLVIILIAAGNSYAKENHMIRKTAQENATFALDLYQRLKTTEGNLFFSPFSISAALAMTYAGARENTARQMAAVLHFTEEPNRFHRSMAKVLSRFSSLQKETDVELRIANALWAQQGYQFLNEFFQIVRQSYQAELNQVDFAAAAEAARRSINTWVEHQTNRKIKDLIRPGVVNALTRLVLVNAIYFKGFWESQFEPGDTQKMEFWLSAEATVKLPMMQQKHRFGYWENDWLQVLEMPYKDESLSLIVLLAKEKTGISELEQKLTLENVTAWQNQLRKRKVHVFFPKFEIESEFNLSQTLTSMGMPDAFNPDQADFSAMAGNKDLYISAVVHKAFVEVNEEGTEAAAATGAVVGITSIAPPSPVFKADHPFIFFIRDNASRSILFLGRVANPTT